MAHKSTKLESHLKVQEIYGRLTSGQSRTRILHDCSEQWGCSQRQIETYLARARQMIEDDCAMARPAFLAELLAGVRDVREKAMKTNNHGVALACIKLQAELTGLTS